MKILLSYGDVRDQATGLRLQALAAVHGLSVFVPPAFTRREAQGSLEPEVLARLGEADVVLGVVAWGLSDACRSELDQGLQRSKHTVVMAGAPWASVLSSIPGLNVVSVDPFDPNAAEARIMGYLKAIEAEETSKRNLLALGTVALGLFMLARQD